MHCHFEVPEQTCGSDLLRREKDSSHQGAVEVKYSSCPITIEGNLRLEQVCEESETASGKIELSRAQECVGIFCEEASPGWFSPKAYLWMKVQQPWGPLAQRDEASD